MSLAKAIKILSLENKWPWNQDNSELREAIKLGIEALRDKQALRIILAAMSKQLLAGETEE